VFMTYQTFTGDLRAEGNAPDTFTAADKLCQVAALNAHLGGQWRAFLSGKVSGDSTIDAAEHVGDGPFYLPDRTTLVFESKARMAGNALAAIDWTERGPFTGVAHVWTGTYLGAYHAPACEDESGQSWMSASSRANGLSGTTAPELVDMWAGDGKQTKSCAERASLYCFEQP